MQAHKRRPTIAKEWQLAVLKSLHAESENPAGERLLAAVAETGLDEKWIRNWFTRQRLKVARHTKGKGATTEPRRQRAHVPTFKVDLHTPDDPPPTPVEPPSRPLVKSLRQPSTVIAESRSSATSRSFQTISAPTYLNNSSTNTTSSALSTYSRDPLFNRYPDFSQFFLPKPQARPPCLESPTPIDAHNPLMPLQAVPNMGLCTPMQCIAPNPLHPPAQPSFPANVGPCPIAFSMKLVDLLGRL